MIDCTIIFYEFFFSQGQLFLVNRIGAFGYYMHFSRVYGGMCFLNGLTHGAPQERKLSG